MVRIVVIRFIASMFLATLLGQANAHAQLTKVNVGYVGITSALIARDTGIYARNGLDVQLVYLNERRQHGGSVLRVVVMLLHQ